MGKRSSFPRRERDLYPTPLAAVPPLLPHLVGVRTFAEPCADDGALVRHLEGFGLRCGYAGDLATGQDALAATDFGAVDAIITNPPYERPVMHALIAHFQRIAPTWLLLELDWTATKQAIPYLAACRDIVSIGRLKWIPGSPHAGKENFAWCRFDARHSAGPVFHAQHAPRLSRCQRCGATCRPQRSDARFCSSACRQRAYRERLAVTQV